MEVYIKRRSDFKTVLLGNAETWSVPVATVTGETGKVSLVEYDQKEHTDDWLYINGSVALISQAAPQNNKLQITAADASEAFDRQAVWPESAPATYGGFIQAAFQRDYINCTDSAYQMNYLTVSNSDSTPLMKPELDDTQLYTLADIISQARRAGVLVQFSIQRDKTAGDRLHVDISTVSGQEHKILFNDGHAQLSSETYSRESVAKVTVLQELETEGEEVSYSSTDYYLSASGEISTTVPAERAEGRWEYTTAKKDDEPLVKATEIFAGNINSHKIEFFSDKRYELFDTVLLRLNGAVFKTQIVYIGRSSSDNRYAYKCGELAVTLTDKVRAGSGSTARVYSSAGGGERYGVGILESGSNKGWTYRKFSDGSFDAWAYTEGTITNGYSSGEFPDFISGTPFMITQPTYIRSGGMALNAIITAQPMANKTYNLYFRNGNETNITGPYSVTMLISGNWA